MLFHMEDRCQTTMSTHADEELEGAVGRYLIACRSGVRNWRLDGLMHVFKVHMLPTMHELEGAVGRYLVLPIQLK
jgi:hypothetical protein